jgi:hypothetical protein
MARTAPRGPVVAVLATAALWATGVVALDVTASEEGRAAGARDGAAPRPPSGPAPEDTAPPVLDDFPGADDTGVPPGTTLVAYAGPCTLTEPVVLSGVDATGTCPAIVVQARGVRIEASRVPRVESTTAPGTHATSSVEVVDSEVVAGAWIGGAVWGDDLTVRRVEVTGGQHSVHCGSRCLVEDSWLHDQFNPDGEAAHNNAFISNGGSDIVLRRNTLHCTAELNATGGGCTANLSLFGDFGPISDVLVEGNLLRANGSSASYCAYGGHAPGKPHPVATGVVFTGNVFERGPSGTCGVHGAVTSFQADAAGNLWRDNIWGDGTALVP